MKKEAILVVTTLFEQTWPVSLEFVLVVNGYDDGRIPNIPSPGAGAAARTQHEDLSAIKSMAGIIPAVQKKRGWSCKNQPSDFTASKKTKGR